MVRFHPRSPMENKNTNSEIWRPVMIFYAKTTSWIIFPLAIAFFLGKYFKANIGGQVLFFICVGVGFLITIYGIYREIKIYQKDLEKKEKNGNE